MPSPMSASRNGLTAASRQEAWNCRDREEEGAMRDCRTTVDAREVTVRKVAISSVRSISDYLIALQATNMNVVLHFDAAKEWNGFA